MPFDLTRLASSPYANPRVLLGAGASCLIGLAMGAWLTPPLAQVDPDPYANFQPPALEEPAALTGSEWMASQPPPLQPAVWTVDKPVRLQDWTDPPTPAPIADVQVVDAPRPAPPAPEAQDVRDQLFDPAVEYADAPPPPPPSDGPGPVAALEP